MKVCPQCAFANDERYPTCVMCNELLVDVPSTPSADPNDPEHEQRAILQERHSGTRRQIRNAGIIYALAITLLAAFPGLVLDPLALPLYFVSGLVTAGVIARDYAGQFSAAIVQGAFSLLLILLFGPMQPFIVFMLVGHLTLPGFLWHWTEMIHSANR